VIAEIEFVVKNDAEELGGGGAFDRDAVEVDREWGVVLGVSARRDEVQELEFGEVELEPYPFCTWARRLFHVGLYLHDVLGDGVRCFDSTDVVDVARILVVQEFVDEDEEEEGAERRALGKAVGDGVKR
jgi:hypothetical protein